MRLVFLGSPAPVIAPLQSLLDSSQHEVVAVVSQPARPVGRKGVLTDPPVAQFAKEQGLACLQPEKARDPEFLAALKDLQPDVCITAAYGQILTDDFLAIPTRATINIHPSMLPKYRGATPIPSALRDGCTTTGVTLLFTVRALDAGHIINQETYDIGTNETAGELTDRLFAASGEQLLAALEQLSDPNFTGTAQDEAAVTHCTKILKEHGLVDFGEPAATILNRYRAHEPWPGTFAYLGDKRVVFTSLRAVDQINGSLSATEHGAFVFDKPSKSLQVRTADGVIAVQRLKPAGSKEVDAPSFWNGAKGKLSEFRFRSEVAPT